MPSSDLTTAEYHTAGEPFRIVTAGYQMPQGSTILERRTWAQANLDDVRALLVNEPRGHADMYGGFIVPPDDDGADIGVLFFHKDGFSTACGHGTIALATWLIDSGRVHRDQTVEMHIDVPSGRLRVVAELDSDGAVGHVRFWNVDSFVTAEDLAVKTSFGTFSVNVSFGGAFYGSVPLDRSTLTATKDHLGELIDAAREIKAQFVDHPAVSHADERLSGMYGVIFHEDLESSAARPGAIVDVKPGVEVDVDAGVDVDVDATLQQRNVTVFADGEVDRSPCGSGTSARLAVLHGQGRLDVGDRFFNHGIAGGIFDARIEAAQAHDGVTRTATSVAGAAYATGHATFTLDGRDPIGLGFLLR